MKSFHVFAVALASLVLGATLSLGGCGEADEAFDCAQVCNAYNDCVNDDTDFTECSNSCQDWADENSANEDRLDACAECIDSDDSCAEQVFGCGLQCAFIPTS